MYLKSLKLKNFRNYSELDFKFSKKITVLIGNNAQGKTNFLESVYFLATTKSPKAESDDELIRYGQDILRVEGENDNKVSLEISIQSTEGNLLKKVKVNRVPRRVFDYSSNLVVVLFAPENVNLVTGSPSLRRNFLDTTISQIDRNYKRALSNYEQLITRKNKVSKRIREGLSKRDELSYWLDQQLDLAQILIAKRVEFFKFINSIERKFGSFNYQYIQSEINKQKLNDYLDREIASASSLIGPHRDDFLFFLGDRDLAKFGSRGEQRTAVLDLKFAEVSFLERELSDRPILLLDDIFSELDNIHRTHVIDLSNSQQTIISTVEWDDHLEKSFEDAGLYLVVNGNISKK